MPLKQPKRLTLEEKKAVSAYKLRAEDWMLLKDGDPYITIIHKQSGETRIIDKYARAKKGDFRL